MNNFRKLNYSLFFLIGFSLLSTFLYLLIFRKYVIWAYEGSAPDWIENLMEFIYPRFIVEKQRFDLSFFINKADQVVIRLNLVLFVTALYLYLKSKTYFKSAINTFWSFEVSPVQQKWLINIFYAGVIFYCHDWHLDLRHYNTLKAFYQPILLFKVLNLKFIDYNLLALFSLLLLISATLVIFNFKTFLNSVICAVAFVMLQGYFHSFEKIDHNFVTLTLAVILMPLFIQERKGPNDWPLRLIQLSLAGTYLFSGLEKVFTSGFTWAESDTFKAYLYMHQAPLGLQVMEIPLLTVVLPAAALVFQLGFPLIFFFYRYRILFILTAVAFHIGTVLLFNIGDFTNPWMFTLIFFLPSGKSREHIEPKGDIHKASPTLKREVSIT